MRLTLASVAAVTMLVGCGQATNVTVKPSLTAGLTASLITRPLKLPAVQPGAPCPVTPVAAASPGVGDPRGRGPFYLGGSMPKAAFPWNKTVYLVTGQLVAGPILFRGARIDGAGRLQFSGDRVTPSDAGMFLSSGGGVSEYFYDRAFEPAGGGALYVYPSSKGCYAIQVDASTFEDVIVVSAS